MKTEDKLDLLLQTGALLLGSGANSTRIERAIFDAAKILKLPADHVHLHLNLRTIMISLDDEGRQVTKFRKVKALGVNMFIISGMQRALERMVAAGAPVSELESELKRVGKLGQAYPEWLILLAVGAADGGFCTVLGGSVSAILFAVLGTMAGLFVRRRLHHAGFNLYFTVMIAAITACLVASLNILCHAPVLGAFNAAGLNLAADTAPTLAVAASVLFLIPGVPLINTVDDLLDGYTMMGIGRATIAMLIVLSIACGVIVTLNLLNISKI